MTRRISLSLWIGALLLAGAMLLPLAAAAAARPTVKPTVNRGVQVIGGATAETRARSGTLGYGYSWTVADYLRYFKYHRYQFKS